MGTIKIFLYKLMLYLGLLNFQPHDYNASSFNVHDKFFFFN